MSPTAIEWTDETWNPVVGCTKVSQGCKNCYAKTLHDRRHKAFLAGKDVAQQYAEPFERVQLMHQRVDAPLFWLKPRRVFVNSVSDLFHPDVPDSFLDRVFAVMQASPHHTFQILTKRPERMAEYMRSAEFRVEEAGEELAADMGWCHAHEGAVWPPRNVWLGTSVENQDVAVERIPHLMDTNAAVRFLSCEPLLGPVDLRPHMAFDRFPGGFAHASPLELLDWVIVGGESGKGARAMHVEWARFLRDQCIDAGVAFFFKQWGEYDAFGIRVGKKRAGRLLDNREWNEYPSPLVPS